MFGSKTKKQSNTETIKSALDLLTKKYTLKEFNDVAEGLTEATTCDSDKIKSIMSKFATVKNGTIRFDTSDENDTSYKELKELIKGTNEKTKDVEQSTNKKGGFPFSMKKSEIEDSVSEKEDSDDDYCYPIDKFECIKKTEFKFGPYGTQWIHDKQKDDEISKEAKAFTKTVLKLMEIDYPEQKSDEWKAQRVKVTSASDGGCVVGVNL